MFRLSLSSIQLEVCMTKSSKLKPLQKPSLDTREKEKWIISFLHTTIQVKKKTRAKFCIFKVPPVQSLLRLIYKVQLTSSFLTPRLQHELRRVDQPYNLLGLFTLQWARGQVSTFADQNQLRSMYSFILHSY